jgi:hypothetical protein
MQLLIMRRQMQCKRKGRSGDFPTERSLGSFSGRAKMMACPPTSPQAKADGVHCRLRLHKESSQQPWT